MSGLDIFALIVLLVLMAAVVAVWVVVGIMPGRIARSRNHPQADAINACGWWGVITLGILCPLAFIWAYTKPVQVETTTRLPEVEEASAGSEEGDAQ